MPVARPRVQKTNAEKKARIVTQMSRRKQVVTILRAERARLVKEVPRLKMLAERNKVHSHGFSLELLEEAEETKNQIDKIDQRLKHSKKRMARFQRKKARLRKVQITLVQGVRWARENKKFMRRTNRAINNTSFMKFNNYDIKRAKTIFEKLRESTIRKWEELEFLGDIYQEYMLVMKGIKVTRGN